MEEKVKVTYQGKILEGTKNDDHYVLRLPPNGTIHRTIYNLRDGWTQMDLDSAHPDYYFWIKLKDDGRIEYENDLMDGSRFSDGKYDPVFSDMETLDEPVRDFYYVAKQLEGHQNLGVSPIEVLELRYKMMGMSLKLLGYQSMNQVFYGEPNPDVSVMDLNRAVQFIEQYPAFAQYVIKGGSNINPTIDVRVPEDFDKEKFKKQFEEVKTSVETETEYYNSRNEFFSNVRHPLIGPEFCLGMKDDIDSKEWASYSETVKKLGKMILSFNSDLLSPGEKMRIVQGTSLNQLDMEHQISLITQIPEMDEALAIESYYFMAQTDALNEKVQESLRDERTRNSSPGKMMKQFMDELNLEADDRKKAIQRRDYYRNVYPYDKSRKKTEPKKKDEEDQVFGD